METPKERVICRDLGVMDYAGCWELQKQLFNDLLASKSGDGRKAEQYLLLCEHPPVYTLGQAGKPEHLLVDNGIPLVKIDRGGQITYHGPGQVVIYLLLDLPRLKIKVRELVTAIEQAVIDLLAEYSVTAERRDGAPGVYVGDAKIAALGLRIRRGCSYHGVALNVQMDLSPFAAINPCGYPGLAVTQTHDLGLALTPDTAADELTRHLLLQLQPTDDTHHG